MRTHLASLVGDFRKHGDAIALVRHRGARRYPSSYKDLAILVGRGVGRASGTMPADPILAAIAEVTREPLADARDTVSLSEDLRLDSLGRVQLGALLQERFGVELPDDAITGVVTLGALRALVEGGLPGAVRKDVDASGAMAGLALSTRPATQAQMPETAQGEVPVYPHWPWVGSMQLLRSAFLEIAIRPLVAWLAAPRVVCDAPLPPGPLLIVCNHVTTYDVPLLLYALPGRLRRHVAVAMLGELLGDMRRGRNQGSVWLNLLAPAGYWLITALFNVFPLPRLRGFRRSFAHAGEAMDRGYSVLVFPEGRRSHGAPMAPFQPGIALLAKETGVPVLPVALRGAQDLGSAKSGWFRSGKLSVHVGVPVTIDPAEEPEPITRLLEGSVRNLMKGNLV